MRQLIHLVVEVRHVDLIVSRDRCHQYLMSGRIERDHHVYIAPARLVDRTIHVNAGNGEVERFAGNIRNGILIVH